MAVMARDTWTDERLGDLNAKVDTGFADMRTEFRATRAEMAANHRTLVQMAAGIWITAVVGFFGVIGTIVAVVLTHG
jgi:hypothetical protein